MNDLYRHYKGALYRMLHEDARIESNQEPVVVYQAVHDGRIWVRPVNDFCANVDTDKGRVPRFAPIHPSKVLEKRT